MSALFLISLVGLLLVVLSPFFILSKKTAPITPGISHEFLKPGYRKYTIIVPDNYTGEEARPLILALHFSGHGIPYYGELILTHVVEPAFREIGAVMIAPDCPVQDWTQPESERFVIDLLADIQERFNIDPERILITGYSLGGTGTYHFAGRYPAHFSAAIVMAGKPPDDVLEIEWQIPLMVIHGRQDEVVSFQETKDVISHLEENGVDITFRILEGTSHYNTHFFVGALQNAIPWLYEKWHINSQ
jgi:predicted peptidase